MVRTVVVGSGCAGLNAADTLAALGETSLLLVTEDMNAGRYKNVSGLTIPLYFHADGHIPNAAVL